MVFPLGELIGAIDIGTSRIKAGIYDESGTLLELVEVRSPLVRKGEVAEHEPLELIRIIREIFSRLSSRGVRCAGITTYRGSLILWDSSNGKPLTNIITWMDLRSSLNYRNLPLRYKMLSKLPKVGSIFSPESLITRLYVLLKERADLKNFLYLNKVCVWNVDAFIVHNLVKKCYTDASIGTLTGIYHPKNFKELWSLVRIAGLKRFRIPKIIEHGKILGTVGDIKLGGVIGDQQAASLGSECIDKGCLKISIGSGLFMDLSLGEEFKLLTRHGLLPIVIYKTQRRTLRGVEAYIPGVGLFVDAVLSLLGKNHNMLEEALKVKNPKFILPTIYGLRYPRVLGGLSLVAIDYVETSSRRIIGSALHSMALLTSFYYKIILKSIGEPKKVVVTGGLSRSRALVKLISSYLGRPVIRTLDPHTSLRGAAELAREACDIKGLFSPLATEVIEPDDNLKLLSERDLIGYIKCLRFLEGGRKRWRT
jgi:glycerol kinase